MGKILEDEMEACLHSASLGLLGYWAAAKERKLSYHIRGLEFTKALQHESIPEGIPKTGPQDLRTAHTNDPLATPALNS